VRIGCFASVCAGLFRLVVARRLAVDIGGLFRMVVAIILGVSRGGNVEGRKGELPKCWYRITGNSDPCSYQKQGGQKPQSPLL
jgi:hypothetical protein